MCLGYAATILQLDKQFAKVDMHGVKQNVSVELIQDAKEGDRVMIHAGLAIAKINDDEDDLKKLIE